MTKAAERPLCPQTGKVICATKAEARRAMRGIKHTHGSDPAMYQCKHCVGWHVTGRSPKRKPGHITGKQKRIHQRDWKW